MSIAGDLFHVINGDAWDDLSFPAAVVPIRGQQGDPDYDTDGTLLFDSSSAEQIAFFYQMPHSWKSTGVRFHVHWGKTTNASGGVVWEMRYRKFNIGEVPPEWSDWTAATIRSHTIDATQKMLIDGWVEIDMTGLTGSCALSIQVRRNPDATADTYAADIRLFFADIHYRRFGLGSTNEYPS